ncbi:MAG: exodeoxyribonuclease VII small subunit [Oscillospiraceae bacterium]
MATAKSKEQPTEQNFEEALLELETIVSSLEKGELSLEESMAVYEKGIKLTANLNNRLKTAKLKIEELKAQ